MKLSRSTCAAAAALVAAAASPALAQMAPDQSAQDTNVSLSPSGTLPVPSTLLAQAATPAATPAPPPAPAAWVDGIKFNAQIEAGVTVNPFSQGDKYNLNFGQLFTDHQNQPMMNQALLTVSRALDPKNPDFDVGFKLQVMYGTDARYAKYMGEFMEMLNSEYQFTLVEANVTMHVPVGFTSGGLDLKIGQYPTPLGYEVIDASGNPFYSHSYIFNFNLPFTHTGGYGVLHATPMVDLYGGVDSGENTTIGGLVGDNNSAPGYLGGINLTLLDGNLTALLLTHFGPENPWLSVPKANCCFRFENDAVITYKYNDKTTFTTEASWTRDNYFKANGIGVAQYVSYTWNDNVTLNARAEVFRDDKGFFVAEFPGNLNFVRSEFGQPTTVLGVPQGYYSEYTVGLTWKPPGLPGWMAGLMVRPELRLDAQLGGPTPVYNGFTDRVTATGATDVILQF